MLFVFISISFMGILTCGLIALWARANAKRQAEIANYQDEPEDTEDLNVEMFSNQHFE